MLHRCQTCPRKHGQIHLHSSVRLLFPKASHFDFFICACLWERISVVPGTFLSIISISEHRWAVTVTFIVWILGCLWERRTLHSPVRLCICALIAPDFSQVSQSLAFQQWNITVSLTSASTKISWKYFYIFLKENKKTPPTYILDSLKWSPWV